MKKAEAVQALKAKFGDAIVSEIDAFGEITIEFRKDQFKAALSFLKQAEGPGYEVLMDLTGVDYVHDEKKTKIVYLLHNPENYERIRITVFVGRDEALPTVTDLWEGANWYERELFDLFGIKFDGHPDLKRILLPDDWTVHPCRRDFALTEEPVEFKHGVVPKVPSQIIPFIRSKQKASQLGNLDNTDIIKDTNGKRA